MKMLTLFSIQFSLLVLCGFCSKTEEQPRYPKFPSIYIAEGEIHVPQAKIIEPFKAYFDGKNKRSRVDYYNGMDITIQRADVKPYGTEKKIVHTHEHERKCFQINGTEEAKTKIQSVVTDLTTLNYTYSAKESASSDFDVWIARKQFDTNKNGHYKLFVTKGKDVVPVRFQMLGLNVVMQSHYDSYEMVYNTFQKVKKIDEKIFDVPDVPCTKFAGRNDALYNPMKDFVDHDTSHVDNGFDEFKNKHNKHYTDHKEHEIRKNNYKHNLRFIHSTNRQGNSFTLSENHLADWSEEEAKVLGGRLKSDGNDKRGSSMSGEYSSDIPDFFDWREYGAVSPVRDQGLCSGCWSFATVGAIEVDYFKHTGRLVSLSEQSLIDCNWDFGNNGCHGGLDYRAYNWILNNSGIPVAKEYGPYLGQDGVCRDDELKTMKSVKISNYVNLPTNDTEAMRVALYNFGAISVTVDSSHKSFRFYSSGVFYEPKCTTVEEELNHQVLAVGYGIKNGEKYWIIKNSWSIYWGNKGYMHISQKDNNCGVATAATFVTFD